MKRWIVLSVLILMAGVLVGCGGGEEPAEGEVVSSAYTSEVLDTGYDDALDVGNQLALGTLKLEETEHAVTSEQAKTLLTLWQALQGGVTAEGEISAVLKGIEGAMTEEQLTTIAEMQLTQEDMQVWLEEQGPGVGNPPGGDLSPDALATRQAEFDGEGMPSSEDTPSDMDTRRAQFQSMSEEERETMRATMQAGGGPGSRTGAGDAARIGVLIRPLIELLTERAG
jgi:hypothetical protein